MTLRRTLWRPDTCSCTVVFEWDDTVPQNSRVHTPVADPLTTKCAAHAGATTPADHYADLMGENPRKNKAEARLLAAFPAKLGTTNANGDVVLKDNAYTYTITGTRGNRVLTLSLPLLTGAERNAVQTWCDNNLRAGKVVVTP